VSKGQRARSRRAKERRGRATEGQRSGGAEGQRDGGEEERRSGGAEGSATEEKTGFSIFYFLFVIFYFDCRCLD
jgi:hypothetical protein